MNNTTVANNNYVLPLHEMAKEIQEELIKDGFQPVPDEHLSELIQIIGKDSAFGFRYGVDNILAEDCGELCTIFQTPNASPADYIYDGVVQLQIADDKYNKSVQYLQLRNIDKDNHIIFSYPIKEIGNMIFYKEDDSIEICFSYRNLSINLGLSGLDIDEDY